MKNKAVMMNLPQLVLCIFSFFILCPSLNAQTRCPIGTQMGSMQCIPDTPDMRGQQAPPPRPTGEWIKTWGAIARSNSTGEAGSAVGKFSESEAQQAATEQCALGGAKDCEVRLSYQNQCAALVSSNSQSFYHSSVSKKAAIKSASKSCEASDTGSCKVIYSECSEPFFRKY
ncbi:DUF4189 domain-containing protein [Xanthomonas nasturtii]|uniref:DUF4189 domain-containing protein n=1 Tax=Xanthomonas nasturtii TaxID=1843581 RepID=UPI001EFBB374|nr:DUF4189 domain-containing protein [Xanthomonas nasturtii]WVL55296.1 DUF4189 domain-containing protein [Xanthomonas nasturtii]